MNSELNTDYIEYIKLDFEQARIKHLLFKSRLRSLLYGVEVDEKPVVSEFECTVGKWLHYHAMKAYRHVPEIILLERLHQNIHVVARTLLEKYKQGNGPDARKGLAQIDGLSEELLNLLQTIEEKVLLSPPQDNQSVFKNLLDVNMQELNDLIKANQALEQRIHEQAIKQQQFKERFELVAKATHDVIWDWDLLTGKLWWNEGLKILFGYDVQAVEPGIESWYNRLHPDDKQRVLDSIHQVVENGGTNWSAEYRFLKADGTYAHIFDRGYTLLDAEGKAYRMVGSMMDISERKQLLEALSESEERFRVAVESAELGTWDFNITTGEIKWSDRARELFGLQSSRSLRYEEFIGAIHPDDKNWVNQLVEEAMANETDGFFEADYRTTGIEVKRSRWLRAKGKVFFTAHGAPYRFIGTVLDITEQKKNELNLRASEKRFRTVFNNAAVGMVVADVNGRFVQANPVYCKLVGYTEEELRQIDFPSITHPDDIKRNLAFTQKAILGEVPNYVVEKRYIKKSGEVIWAQVWVSVMKDGAGNADSLIAIVHDITKEKRAREEQQKLVSLIENSNDYIAMADLQGKVTFTNKGGRNMVGIDSFEESLTHNVLDYFLPEDLPEIENKVLPQLISEGRFAGELRLRHFKTGEVIPIYSNSFRIDDPESGKPLAIATVSRDLREQKKADEALRKSAAHFRFLAESMPQKVWTADIYGSINYLNQHWAEYTGITIEELVGWGWKKVIHPDDWESTNRLWLHSIESGQDFEVEHRFIRQDGAYRWHLTRGIAQRNQQGGLIMWIGTNTDIHDQKQTEESLKLQARILESMDEGVSVSDENGFILYTNDAEDKMFGYEPGELIGKHVTVQNAYQPEENEQIVASVMQQLKEKGFWSGEWFNVKKDGTTFYTHAHITTLKVGAKNLMVCVQRDVTEERKNKIALAYQNNLVKIITDNATSTLFMMDKNGYCTFMNPSGEKMFGYTFEEISSKPLHYMIHHHRPDGSYYPMEECPIDRALPENFDIRAHRDVFFRKDGTAFPVSCAASPIFENGVPVATVIEVRDITQEVMAEEALQRSAVELERKVQERTKELQAANERLEKSNNELEQFAYVASHDLQEPLRKIQIFGDRLQSQAYSMLNANAQNWLDKILSAAQRMSTLIKDLLDYSRHTRKNIQYEFTRVDLNEVVKNILTDLELRIQQKEAVVKVSELPIIEAVELQMNQLFYNLITNALKFNPPDRTPLISISAHFVSTQELEQHRLPLGKEYCKIVFSDNGIGFRQELAEQIFVIFQRLNSRDQFPGTGIGLALCRKVVHNHRGVIYAEGKENEGATFTIILPVQQEEEINRSAL